MSGTCEVSGVKSMKISFEGTYDFVCGIGHYCVTASYLKRHCLRTTSGPFDWHAQEKDALLSNVKLIETDFRDFLKQEALVKFDKSSDELNNTDKDFYRNVTTGISFYHDFPRGVDLKDSYPAVRTKYDRRIARFYEQAKAGRTLLIYHTRTDQVSDEVLSEALTRLRQKLSTQVDLLVIQWDRTREDVAWERVADGGYRASGPLFAEDVRNLLGKTKLCDRIYGAIPFRGKWRQRLRRFLLKLKGSLRLSRTARHSARKGL